MNKIYLILSLILAFHSSHAQINNYENGDIVNDFTVVDVSGNTHNLYAYTAAGKYVFLDFFYAACGGCQNFVPVFNEFYDKYGCNAGEVVCIAMNRGDDKDAVVIDFENTYGGVFNHAPAISLDGGCVAVDTDFDPKYYPACVLIGPDNTMVNNDINPIDTVSDLEAAFPVDFNPQPMNCTLSIYEYDSNPIFSIFPNPTDGRSITIKTNVSINAQIIIYNILGEIAYSNVIHGTEKRLNINLLIGTYFVTLQTNVGKTNQKLIVM